MPGSIGAAYTSKPIFNEIRDRWSNDIARIFESEYVARGAKQTTAKPKPQGQSTAPVAPPASNKPPSLSELRRQAGGK